MTQEGAGCPGFCGGPRNSPTLAELVDEIADGRYDSEEGEEKELDSPQELSF